MDPVRNPFAPLAGHPPPHLAGRASFLDDARVAMARALIGKPIRSQMLLGGCAVGKTALLVQIEVLARQAGHLTSRIDASAGRPLSEQLVPAIRQVLHDLAPIQPAQVKAHQALGALSAFARAARVDVGPIALGVESPVGVADSGHLDNDLADLLACVGQAARAGGAAWTLLIDDVQRLRPSDLAALLAGLHRIGREQLPVLWVGAGLPQVAALAGAAQPYAERLLCFRNLEPLRPEDARAALQLPIEVAGARISEDALDEIVRQTAGHPYILQEWGYQCWEVAQGAQITAGDARQASAQVSRRLDSSYFPAQCARLTPTECTYVVALARQGSGSQRAGDIAAALGQTPRRLESHRARLVNRGVLSSPTPGEVAFTVPGFGAYLRGRFVSAPHTAGQEP